MFAGFWSALVDALLNTSGVLPCDIAPPNRFTALLPSRTRTREAPRLREATATIRSMLKFGS
jgi:hypothetical protein